MSYFFKSLGRFKNVLKHDERMQRNLLIVIPGFGDPHLEFKTDLLVRNIITIRNSFIGDMSILIFLYTKGMKQYLLERLWFCADTLKIHEEPGRLGYFMYKYVKPSYLKPAMITDVMIMLDDVSLPLDFNTDLVLNMRDAFHIDVISPSISVDSTGGCHSFMTSEGLNILKITNFVELFCYIMTFKAYEKYMSLFTHETIYMWGIDIAMYPMLKLKMAIYDACVVKHYFSYSWVNPQMMKDTKRELHYTKKRLRNNNFCFVIFEEIDYEPYRAIDKKFIRRLHNCLLHHRHQDDRFRGLTTDSIKKHRK